MICKACHELLQIVLWNAIWICRSLVMVKRPSCYTDSSFDEMYICVCERLSNVALAGCLGVRSLSREEQLHIWLCRLGKYFSTREEICIFW
jgi:hypothetical protein